jgi:hypothetical protein
MKRVSDYLVGLGTAEVPHTGTRFLSHLLSVARDLKEWGCPEHLQLAGAFHSIYGTEAFAGFALPLTRRAEVQSLVGERAERLAYVNCALTRATLDASVAAGGPPRLWDRFENAPLPVSDEEFTDLLTLHLCDRLEQVARSGNWEVRRESWERMARRLGGVPLERWEAVYGQAPP